MGDVGEQGRTVAGQPLALPPEQLLVSEQPAHPVSNGGVEPQGPRPREESHWAPFLRSIVAVLCLVVMPGFCFASGHLSSSKLTPRRLVALLRVWVVALLQQAIWALFLYLPKSAGKAWLPFPFWSSAGVVWYLLCLALWRTMLPFLSLLRWPFSVSVVISTLALFLDSSKAFMWQPAFTFLPFFVAGFCTPADTLSKLRRGWPIFIGVLMASACASALPSAWPMMKTVRFAYGCLYADLIFARDDTAECSSWSAALLHLALLAASLLLIPGFLGCVPQRRVWGLTRAGAMSLYIYLLHLYGIIGVFVLVTRREHHLQRDELAHGLVHGALGVLGVLAFGCFLWGCLALGWARVMCWLCVEPRVERCLRSEC